MYGLIETLETKIARNLKISANDDESRRDAAIERYYASVSECNYSDCPHYSARRRQCSREICAYEQKDPSEWDEENETWADGGEFEWVE